MNILLVQLDDDINISIILKNYDIIYFENICKNIAHIKINFDKEIDKNITFYGIFGFSPKNNINISVFNYYTKKIDNITVKENDIIVFNGTYNIIDNPEGTYYYLSNPYKYIFNNTFQRIKFSKDFKKNFLKIKKQELWKQNIDSNLTIIGSGCYGSVFEYKLDYSVAVKYSKLRIESIDSVKNFKYNWHELIILKNILNPLIEKGVSNNIPYLIEYLLTDNCKFENLKRKNEDDYSNDKCLILVNELASFTLRQYLSTQRNEKELLSCLFQIMYGLHTVQNYGQILHFDIKVDNILCYEIIKGGYWRYTILDEDFYVPNCGFLFVTSSPPRPENRSVGARRRSRPGHP